MVQQLDTQQGAYEKKTLHSIKWPIITSSDAPVAAGITFVIYMCPRDTQLTISEKPQQLPLAQYLLSDMQKFL